MTDHGSHENVVSEAQAFVAAEIAPRAHALDDSATGLTPEVIGRMAARGYLGATFPRELGGLALDPVAYGLVTFAFGRACSSARALLTLQVSLVGESILKWGTKDQVERWIPSLARGEHLAAFALSEPGVGTDARSVKAAYVKRGDRYVINGHKKWMTFGAIASLFLVIAQEDGNVTAFLVPKDAPGVTVRRMNGLLGLRGGHLGEIFFENVEVSESAVLGGVGNGFRYIANWALDHGRYSVAWAGAALVQACVDGMVSYARRRSQFDQKLAEFPQVQALIGNATAKSYACQALCMRVGELRKSGAPDAMIETSIAKFFTSVAANDVARDAIQVHGGNGCSDAYPVECYFREAKVLEIIEGTSEVQQQLIARHALQRFNLKTYGVAEHDRV